MKDPRNLTIGLLIIIIAGVVYYFVSREDPYLDYLEQQVKKQQEIIKQTERLNDSLSRQIDLSKNRVQDLERAIDSTQKEVEDAKQKIEQQRREFSKLTPAIRDSLIRAFIRENQRATNGNG